ERDGHGLGVLVRTSPRWPRPAGTSARVARGGGRDRCGRAVGGLAAFGAERGAPAWYPVHARPRRTDSPPWYRRSEIERRYRLDGTLEDGRRLLDEAVAAERRAVLADPSDEAGRRRAWLDALPPGTAAAVSALADYAWSTAAGRENAERIRVLLGEQVLRSRFEGTRQTVAALQARDSTSPERVEQVNRMLLDLNALLSARAQGFGDIEARFVEFLRRHNGFFAKNPRDVDELIDALGVRAAAAQRLLNSLAPKQRRELLGLSHQAFGDARIIQRLSELDDLLRVLRPELDWTSPARF